MDHGQLPAVKDVKSLLRVMTYPDHAKKKCPLCDMEEPDPCLLEHFTTEHTKKQRYTAHCTCVEHVDHHGPFNVLCFLLL